MAEAVNGGNVVARMTIGNTRVMICDDYCRTRTDAEVKAILSRIARRALKAMSATSTNEKEYETAQG